MSPTLVSVPHCTNSPPVLWVQCKISFTFNIYSLQLWWENSWESCLIWYVNEFYCTVTAAYERTCSGLLPHSRSLNPQGKTRPHDTYTTVSHPSPSIHPSIHPSEREYHSYVVLDYKQDCFWYKWKKAEHLPSVSVKLCMKYLPK